MHVSHAHINTHTHTVMRAYMCMHIHAWMYVYNACAHMYTHTYTCAYTCTYTYMDTITHTITMCTYMPYVRDMTTMCTYMPHVHARPHAHDWHSTLRVIPLMNLPSNANKCIVFPRCSPRRPPVWRCTLATWTKAEWKRSTLGRQWERPQTCLRDTRRTWRTYFASAPSYPCWCVWGGRQPVRPFMLQTVSRSVSGLSVRRCQTIFPVPHICVTHQQLCSSGYIAVPIWVRVLPTLPSMTISICLWTLQMSASWEYPGCDHDTTLATHTNASTMKLRGASIRLQQTVEQHSFT